MKLKNIKDINNITNDGFSLSDLGDKFIILALNSLKIALKSYFSTYQSMKYSLHIFDPKNKEKQGDIDFYHTPSYCEFCSEAIIHFQHFVELVCKDILRKSHSLLANDASKKHIIFDKLLKGETISSKEQEKLKSIPFNEALERLCALIEVNRIDKNIYNFIIDNRKYLKQLNLLRNRLWHRVTFILRYPALDNFYGNYLLSFINHVIKLPEYSELEHNWKYEELKCNIDPIKEIIKEFQNNNISLEKIAMLKELGRAAYNNPLKSYLRDFPDLEHLERQRAERIVKLELDEGTAADVSDCPVCGVNSLVIYGDIESDGDCPFDGEYKTRGYTYKVKCMCCTFEINQHLKNPSNYGLSIPDYWK